MPTNVLTKAADASEKVAEAIPDVNRVQTALEDRVKGAWRAVKRGRYVAEERMEDAIHGMKRHPVQTAAIAFGLGLVVGISVGWMISRQPGSLLSKG
jgi:hypothetical protein